MAGSHITKLALASAMQRLMTEQPFERISVSDICTACGMSRKSFYYHFRDKYDLVGWIFEAEFVEPNRERSFSSSWEFFDALCSYFYANRAFYVNAFAMRGQNSFAEYFSEFCVRLPPGISARSFRGSGRIPFLPTFSPMHFLFPSSAGCEARNPCPRRNMSHA